MLTARSTLLVDRLRQRAETAAHDEGDPVGFGFLEIITLALEMFTKFAPLLQFCKTKPPVPPPVPPALAAAGVTAETWTQACTSKFAADASADDNSPTGFSRVALRRATAEIRKTRHITKRAAAPMALAALQTARDETREDIALAAQQIKSNASQFGA